MVIVNRRTAVIPTPALEAGRVLMLVVWPSEGCIGDVPFDRGD